MATKTYTKSCLTGGTSTCLDSIDGDDLAEGYRGLVVLSNKTNYLYYLNATSGATEDGINVIAPDTNPGDKRWILTNPSESNFYFPDAVAVDQGSDVNNNTLDYFVTLIGSDVATIKLKHSSSSATTTYTLTTSLVIPSNITLLFEPGALIDGAGTLTINGAIDSREHQIFGTSITLAGSLKSPFVKGSWFGLFGATSDNVTAAFTQAVNFANLRSFGGSYSCSTLVLNPGAYYIVPGSIPDILCNIDGPKAELYGYDNTLDNLLTLGCEAAYYRESRKIVLKGLFGYGFTGAPTGTRYNYGIGWDGPSLAYCDFTRIEITYIHGFVRGINGDCSTNNIHVGESLVNVSMIGYCDAGIYSNTGTYDNATWSQRFENNVFDVAYMVFCDIAVDSNASAYNWNTQNIYRINTLELHNSTGNGFNIEGVNTFKNIFIVDSITYPQAGGYIVYSTGNLSKLNEFRLPSADYSMLSASGNVFKLDGIGNFSGVAAGSETNPTRSIVYGPDPAPVTGTWTVGDRYIVNDAALGEVSSYKYISTGWVPEAYLSQINIDYVPTVSAVTGTITNGSAIGWYYETNNLVHFIIVVTITTNGTGAGGVKVTLPSTPGASAPIVGYGRESAIGGNALTCRGTPSSNLLTIYDYDNSYPAGDGYILEVAGFYIKA